VGERIPAAEQLIIIAADPPVSRRVDIPAALDADTTAKAVVEFSAEQRARVRATDEPRLISRRARGIGGDQRRGVQRGCPPRQVLTAEKHAAAVGDGIEKA